MPRKQRSDIGMPRERYNNVVRKTGKRGPYKNKPKKPVEPRGMQNKEPLIVKVFWREFEMSQIETLSPEELEILLDKFFSEYEARQIKQHRNWWYPGNPKERAIDLRYNK